MADPRTILAFGDSLTWGFDGPTRARHPFDQRWPNVLQAALGDGYHVISEGLNGRTTGYDDHLADCDRNGARVLPTLLHTHGPLDLVILFLGTNDLKPFTGAGARGAAMGMERLIELVRHHAWSGGDVAAPQILIVAPPPIRRPNDPDYGDTFADTIEDFDRASPGATQTWRRSGVAASSTLAASSRPTNMTAFIWVPKRPPRWAAPLSRPSTPS